jgi:WD40 repeat protein
MKQYYSKAFARQLTEIPLNEISWHNPDHKKHFNCFNFDPTGCYCAFCQVDGSVALWSFQCIPGEIAILDSNINIIRDAHEWASSLLCWSPDNRYVCRVDICEYESVVIIWDLTSRGRRPGMVLRL